MNLKFWKKEVLTPEQKKERKKDRVMLILSGVMLGLSFPPFPFPFTLLMFGALIPYFSVIEKREKLIEINRASYLTIFVFSLLTLYWVGSWQKNADPFLMISGALLVFVSPVFFFIPAVLLYLARKIFPRKVSLYLFPLFWITFEYAYMITDASFPWLTLGSGLTKFLPFIQIADIIGTLGLSLLVLYINVLLYKAISIYKEHGKQNYVSITKLFSAQSITALLLFIVPLIYGFIILNTYKLSDKKIKVGIVQPNLDPWDKWAGGNLDDITELHLDLSQKAVDKGAELIVWPETALPVYLFGGTHSSTISRIYSFLRKNKTYLLTGMPNIIYYDENEPKPDDVKFSRRGNYYYSTYNSILLLSPYTSDLQRYGKMKLVPFGERVPFVDELPFLGDMIKWGVGLSGWNVGRDTTIFKLNEIANNIDSVNICGLVCYESIYPYFVTGFINKNADFIAVVTNDSWYGNSSGPYQHKEFSVLRAVENRRSVIRSANGGISTIIDPLGRTIIETEMFTRDVFTGEVVLQKESTFFSRYPLIIPITASAFSIWIIGISFIIKLKKWLKV